MSLTVGLQNEMSIPSTIARAANESGVDFDYLMKTAMRESSLKSDVKATTSSASGLFQFIEQTWLSTVQQHGDEYGYGDFADAIETDSRGRQFVSDKAVEAEILALRNDPTAASFMAAALTKDTSAQLESAIGREPDQGELYMAHFMGPRGAIELISATENDPAQSAVDMFPRAAAANKSIFYNADGSERSVSEVYANLQSKHNGVDVDMAVASAVSSNSDSAQVSTYEAYRSGGSNSVAGSRSSYGHDFANTTAGSGGGVSQGGVALSSTVLDILASLEIPTLGAGDEAETAYQRREKERNDFAQLRGYVS
ncbi:MAG: lytic transglycosylase domain-containing protein [Parvibaculaceae bacterium]|nr:lytic transglycosylase domain-containing protein [Parvibaculaceae bacterium]